MKRVIDLEPGDARAFFMRPENYFTQELPEYISFGPLLNGVASVIGTSSEISYGVKPKNWANVNYELVANKDGRLNWRPFEIIHPALYVSLINLVCEPRNWKYLQSKAASFEQSLVECCSWPVVPNESHEHPRAEQVRSWWQKIEQRSLEYSLDYSHIIHTDVTNCYGTLYTHSISWALHGYKEAKAGDADNELGDEIDKIIRAGRYGQTNGIPQGSILMDHIAELVLGYVDYEIFKELRDGGSVKILRYRDDYRIFARNDADAECALKVVADKLRHIGMRLGSAKTSTSTNVVESSIKKEKLAAINLQDLGDAEAPTIQKQLLRIHSFCRDYPNSGQARRLLSELHRKISAIHEPPPDLPVQVAIVADIGFISPSAFPAVAAILSHLIALAPDPTEKRRLWEKVVAKMRGVRKHAYLDIWLQRVTVASRVDFPLNSEEPICQLVNMSDASLWENGWITSNSLKAALDPKQIVIASVYASSERMRPEEIALFTEQAEQY